VDAQDTFPQMFLTGDHNLGNGNPPPTAFCNYGGPQTGGNPWEQFPDRQPLALAGWTIRTPSKVTSVWQTVAFKVSAGLGLQEGLKNSGDTGNGASTAFPATAPNGPIGVNRIQFP